MLKNSSGKLGFKDFSQNCHDFEKKLDFCHAWAMPSGKSWLIAEDFPQKQILKKKIAFRNSLIYPDADLGFVSEEYTSK